MVSLAGRNSLATLTTSNAALDAKRMDESCSACRLPLSLKADRCRPPTSPQMKLSRSVLIPASWLGVGVRGARSQQGAPLNIAFRITAVDHFSEIPYFDLLCLNSITLVYLQVGNTKMLDLRLSRCCHITKKTKQNIKKQGSESITYSSGWRSALCHPGEAKSITGWRRVCSHCNC